MLKASSRFSFVPSKDSQDSGEKEMSVNGRRNSGWRRRMKEEEEEREEKEEEEEEELLVKESG